MTKKKQKFVTLFRTQWTSAKATVPPAALKQCDFSAGFGPVLDVLEKKWDAAADLDPVPPKTLADLEGQVVKFQKIAKSYQAKVIQANRSDPANGPGWFALHEALRKIDEGVVQDMKDLGVKCAYTKGWASKDDFNRTAGKITAGGGSSEADSADYRKAGFARLASKVAATNSKDPIAFAKALDNGLRTCLPHSRQLLKTLAPFTGALVTTSQDFVRAAAGANPDRAQAKNFAARAKQISQGLTGAMPPEGKAIATAAAAMVNQMEKAVPR